LVLLAALFWLTVPRPVTPRYTIRRLIAPGFESTSAVSINDHGQALGRANNPNGGEAHFIWDRNGNATEIVLDVEGSAWITQINNRGQVLGNVSAATRTLYSFIWAASEGLKMIPSPKEGVARVLDMNDRGELAGMMWSEDKVAHSTVWNASLEATRIDDATTSQASLINNQGTTFGSSGGRFVLANAPRFRTIEGFGSMIVLSDMNDRVEVIGSTVKGVGGVARDFKAFVWSATHGVEYLGDIPGFDTQACSINNKGQVVGYAEPSYEGPPIRWFEYVIRMVENLTQKDSAYYLEKCTAYIWEEGKMTPLIDLAGNPSGWISLSLAMDINDAGEIVGYGVHQDVTPDYSAGFVLTPIEESEED
jgi:uncharacterized membrane protein